MHDRDHDAIRPYANGYISDVFRSVSIFHGCNIGGSIQVPLNWSAGGGKSRVETSKCTF